MPARPARYALSPGSYPDAARAVGGLLARYPGEWVIVADGECVSHSPRLADAVSAAGSDTDGSAVYFSPRTAGDVIPS